jgi:hypothetical protein
LRSLLHATAVAEAAAGGGGGAICDKALLLLSPSSSSSSSSSSSASSSAAAAAAATATAAAEQLLSGTHARFSRRATARAEALFGALTVVFISALLVAGSTLFSGSAQTLADGISKPLAAVSLQM